MKVHCDEVVASSGDKHVRDEFCCYRCATLVFFILARIRITGYDGSNAACRSSSTRRDENEEFHQVIIDVEATRLNDEDVLISDRL